MRNFQLCISYVTIFMQNNIYFLMFLYILIFRKNITQLCFLEPLLEIEKKALKYLETNESKNSQALLVCEMLILRN